MMFERLLPGTLRQIDRVRSRPDGESSRAITRCERVKDRPRRGSYHDLTWMKPLTASTLRRTSTRRHRPVAPLPHEVQHVQTTLHLAGYHQVAPTAIPQISGPSTKE